MSGTTATQDPTFLRLDKKRTLITGGARGIGRAIADRFAVEGAAVVIADLQHLPGDDPAGCHKVTADVADEQSVIEMIQQTVSRLGGLDVLVHCAGISIHRPLLETPLEVWHRLIDINLTGTFLCNREAARVMCRQKSGSIINIASVAAFLPGVRTHAYSATKGGVATFTKAIANELGPEGVRVNAISPGAIDTDLSRAAHTPAFRASYLARIPMGRYGQPEEIAGTAVFLASEDSRYITGAILSLDGGFASAGIRV